MLSSVNRVSVKDLEEDHTCCDERVDASNDYKRVNYESSPTLRCVRIHDSTDYRGQDKCSDGFGVLWNKGSVCRTCDVFFTNLGVDDCPS